MKIPRRKFIKAGIIAAACAGIPLTLGPATAQDQGGGEKRGGYFPIPAEVQDDPTSYYTMATFVPYVNSGFRLLVGRQWKYMKLMQVKNLCPAAAANAPVNDLGECFSLTFRAARGQKIRQQTYSIRHAALGTFSLFLVPVDRRTRTSAEYYEAVINRRVL